ncbi:MAG: cell division protein FtsA [Candidatus Marinimicrobia bacterium]|nr:cell division protein FtsA [Candidatus Neomarinimicrobiota bacterium]MCH8024326.1 cell division protein FtsA [Candidatus Neomarinimicrobiota bacterium]
MTNHELQSGIISGLDVGTTKVCAVIAQVDDEGRMNLLGMGRTAATGIRKGMVVSVKETIASIEAAVSEAENQADVKMDGVYVALSGEQVRSMNNAGVITVSRGESRVPSTSEIDEDDILRVLEQAKAITLPTEREILHVLPQEFKIDQHDGIKDPLGHVGHRLEARVHLVTVVSSAAQNITRCVEAAGLWVETLILAPLASAYAVLEETEKEQGVVLIDMGGGTTDIIVYYNGGVRHTSVIPFGGNRVTNDIAQILHTTYQKAEELKREHGYAKFPATIEDNEITIEGIAGRQPQTTTKRGLSSIIEPRLEEILALCRNEVRKSEVGDKLTFGVVLTGGGVLLKDIEEKAGEVFNADTKVGYPLHIQGLEDVMHSPEYATATGLLLYGREHQEKYGAVRRPGGIGRFIGDLSGGVKDFFRELF